MRRALFLLLAATCYGQVSARVSLSNGVQLTVSTRPDNSDPVALKASLEPATGDSFYRIFRDENGLAVFAYELQVRRTSDGQNFRVTAKPATEAFANRFPNADNGKPTPTLSSTLDSPLLNSGESFTIPVPTNPGLNQNLTDVVQILFGERGAAGGRAARTGQIRFSGLKVSIQGHRATPEASGADVSGDYAMFYIPGRGGYFFSAMPVDGLPFEQVGVVDGKHLTFTVENEVYDCASNVSILLHADSGQLWVYRDAGYKPSGNWTKTDPSSVREEFYTAAADSIQWWLQ
jgi:hypothetical protein